MKKLSVVVPCYNEQETVEKFYDTAVPVLDRSDMDYEIIFVNDGSRDKTLEKLTALSQKDTRVKVINFSRNFGQQAAILCGFRHSSGDCVVELDCDLQDPIEVVLEMLDKWREGYDVIHGRRKIRHGESFFKKFTAKIYYKFLAKISSFEMPRNTGDFKLLDRRVVDVICNMPEHEKYLRGLESWVGFKQTFVDFDRAERVAGETHYSLKKMINLAKAGIVSNSNYPLSLGFKFGLLLSFLSVAGFITLIVLLATGVYSNLVAWLFPTVGLLFGIKFVIDAIGNLYLGKVYDEVKNRPEYIVSDKINLEK
ncbi:MAG: glycosyltransferase family 2 protein [Clostridia bacterium]|nr:glycosyltransferase family 2 protein [Clostridia bacterium]